MDISGSSVLVTGGAGFIGSHIVDLLLVKGCTVRILDNLDERVHRRGRPDWVPAQSDLINGRVENPADMERALDGMDFVFHEVGLTAYDPEARSYMDVNATGTATIYEVAAKRGFPIRKVVVASSQAIYGEGKYRCQRHGVQHPETRALAQLRDQDWDPRCRACQLPLEPIPTDEESAKNASTPYAIGKWAGERLALTLGRKSEIPTVALRYAVTYGPRHSPFNPYGGVVPTFAVRLLNNRPPILYEDGQQLRDWIFVEDVAKANLFVMEDERTEFEAYNVGTGIATPVREIARLLASHLGRDIEPLTSAEFRPGDVRHLVHDTSKLRGLGFEPQTNLTEGLSRFIEWFSTLGDLEDVYEEFEGTLKRSGALVAPASPAGADETGGA